MSSTPYFISITKAPTLSGSLVFSLETYTGTPALLLTLTITGVQSTDTEEDVATRIHTQLNTLLASYQYDGTPTLSDQVYDSSFRLAKTQHIVSLWSQCDFYFKLTSNSTGCIAFVSDSSAIFTTISMFKEYANIKGISLLSASGPSMTDSQINALLLQGSSQITSYLKSYVVATTYLNTFRGKDTKSVFLRPTPGVSIDNIAVRRKAYINLYTNPTYTASSLSYNRLNGELNYRPDSITVDTRSPFALDNEVQITFIAGYYTIPDEVQWATVDLVELRITGQDNIKKLQGGSGSVEFNNQKDILTRILYPILKFKSK